MKILPTLAAILLQQISSVVGLSVNLRDPRSIFEKENSDRPIIYTFFELKQIRVGKKQKEVDYEPHENLLSVWKDLWTKAGWEPRVLTLNDAKQHPNYEKYSKAILKDTPLFEGSYNYMCFVRWLAMAAHGDGGWMSDNDVFPTGISPQDGKALPNFGRFTSYDKHVPCLLSGSAEEWDRMSETLFDMAMYKMKKDKMYTDMYALLKLHNKNPDIFVSAYHVHSGFAYREKGDLECDQLNKSIAVHISHQQTLLSIQRGEVNYIGGHDFEHEIENVRPELVTTLFDDWRDQCKTK